MPVARHQVEPVLAAAREALEAARRERIPLIAVGNEFRRSDRLGNFFRRYAAMAGSPGAAWDDRLPIPDAAYIPKWKSDAFTNPALERRLQEMGTEEVILAGLFARGCLAATAMSALARCLRVRILAPAVACSSDRSREAALRRLADAGAVITHSLSNKLVVLEKVSSTLAATSGTL